MFFGNIIYVIIIEYYIFVNLMSTTLCLKKNVNDVEHYNFNAH